MNWRFYKKCTVVKNQVNDQKNTCENNLCCLKLWKLKYSRWFTVIVFSCHAKRKFSSHLIFSHLFSALNRLYEIYSRLTAYFFNDFFTKWKWNLRRFFVKERQRIADERFHNIVLINFSCKTVLRGFAREIALVASF